MKENACFLPVKLPVKRNNKLNHSSRITKSRQRAKPDVLPVKLPVKIFQLFSGKISVEFLLLRRDFLFSEVFT